MPWPIGCWPVYSCLFVLSSPFHFSSSFFFLFLLLFFLFFLFYSMFFSPPFFSFLRFLFFFLSLYCIFSPLTLSRCRTLVVRFSQIVARSMAARSNATMASQTFYIWLVRVWPFFWNCGFLKPSVGNNNLLLNILITIFGCNELLINIFKTRLVIKSFVSLIHGSIDSIDLTRNQLVQLIIKL